MKKVPPPIQMALLPLLLLQFTAEKNGDEREKRLDRTQARLIATHLPRLNTSASFKSFCIIP